jgi:hypothetical protein
MREMIEKAREWLDPTNHESILQSPEIAHLSREQAIDLFSHAEYELDRLIDALEDMRYNILARMRR